MRSGSPLTEIAYPRSELFCAKVAILSTRAKWRSGRRKMDIGFIGLGQMGFHMARRLLEAGHRVLVLDRRREAMDRLIALGAHGRDTARALADEVETVMVSLPTPDVVLAVATGAAGVIEGKRVRRFVDLSTTGSVMAKRIFDTLKARNIVQIDSPVSGGVTGAS